MAFTLKNNKIKRAFWLKSRNNSVSIDLDPQDENLLLDLILMEQDQEIRRLYQMQKELLRTERLQALLGGLSSNFL